MNRIYDTDRAPLKKTPLAIAHERSQLIDEPSERHRFMAAFRLGQRYEEQGIDSYVEFQRMWDTGDSVALAGLIEGQASVGRTIRRPPVIRAIPTVAPRKSRLTLAQHDALVDAAQGLTAKQSADRQNTTENAIKKLRFRICRKLGTSRITNAISIAIATGELTLPELRGRN